MGEDLEKYEISEEVKARLDRNFLYHAPKDDQPARYEQIRSMARSVAYTLNTLCPGSRELSLAMTALEEAVFWANASIARNE